MKRVRERGKERTGGEMKRGRMAWKKEEREMKRERE